MIKLFYIEDGKAMPSEHCYTIGYLKDIMDEYGENATKIFLYFHYMWSFNPDDNPFINLPEAEKQEVIVRNICPEIDIDDPLIQEGLELVGKLYETPSYRVFMSFKNSIDKLATALKYVHISLDKDDGNIREIKEANKTYQELKVAYKDAFKEMMNELGSIRGRGGGDLSYDEFEEDDDLE